LCVTVGLRVRVSKCVEFSNNNLINNSYKYNDIDNDYNYNNLKLIYFYFYCNVNL